MIPFKNTSTNATHWIPQNQILLVHECVDFEEYNGFPHLNIYTLYGVSASTPTPEALPITDSFIECFTLFDSDQHIQGQELGLKSAPIEKRKKYRVWFNPELMPVTYENPDPIEFRGRHYMHFAVMLGESTIHLYFDHHPFIR